MNFLQQLGSSGALDALSAGSGIGAGIAGMAIANQNAKQLRQAGAMAESDSLRESARLLGSQRAAYAKAGVDVGSGTPLDVLASTAEQETLRAMRARYGYRTAARTEKLYGIGALSAGVSKAANTILTGYQTRAKGKI